MSNESIIRLGMEIGKFIEINNRYTMDSILQKYDEFKQHYVHEEMSIIKFNQFLKYVRKHKSKWNELFHRIDLFGNTYYVSVKEIDTIMSFNNSNILMCGHIHSDDYSCVMILEDERIVDICYECHTKIKQIVTMDSPEMDNYIKQYPRLNTSIATYYYPNDYVSLQIELEKIRNK